MLYSFSSIQAADATHGKALVQQHCVRCHGTEPYTNENRAVKSLAALNQRVCAGTYLGK